MYRLLIVDDEPMITNSLVELFTNETDMDLDVYKAYSAVEALTYLHKTRMDIVLTDVSMPHMTGLELQKEIKSQWPRCKVIFLSGYNDFEYIHTALRNDSVDYLLKSEPDEKIIEAVRKAIHQIDREINNQKLIEKASKQINQAMPILQKEYLLEILGGAEYLSEERKEQFYDLELPLQSDHSFLLLISRIDYWEEKGRLNQRLSLLYQVQSMVEEYLAGNTEIVSLSYEPAKLVWFIQPRHLGTGMGENERQDMERLFSFIYGTLDAIQSKCRQMLSVSISFVLGEMPVQWEQASERFLALNAILNKGVGLGQEIILTDQVTGKKNIQDDVEESKKEELYSQLKKTDLLQGYLEAGKEKEFNETFQLLMGAFSDQDRVPYVQQLEFYYTLANMFLSYLNRWDKVEEVSQAIDLYKLTRIEEHSSWDAILDYFKVLSKEIFDVKKNEHVESTWYVIENIRDYIHRNISGDLSLVRIAETMHFNPSYLSRLYKQATGQSLSEYISEVKLREAKTMLYELDLKIHQVASRVGFETSSYFTRFFKKHTGISPQEFRDSLQKIE